METKFKLINTSINFVYFLFKINFVFILFFHSCSGDLKNVKIKDTSKKQDINNNIKLEEKPILIKHKNIWPILESKSVWFKNNIKPKIKLNSLNKDFLLFYKNFISDSLYQHNHIDFKKLIGVIGECDTTVILNSKNWKFIKWDLTMYFENDKINQFEFWENECFQSEKTIFFEFKLIEVGVIYQFGFEKAENTWNLTLYYVNNC